MSYYCTAQICHNGHLITNSTEFYPERTQRNCSECGAVTYSACPSCCEPIRGSLCDDNDCLISDPLPPAYCHACGKPYPWTEAALESAKAVIREEDSMSFQQQEDLIEVLPDMIVETPRTNLATVRMKKALASVGSFTADALKSFLIDFGCEVIKRQIGL